MSTEYKMSLSIGFAGIKHEEVISVNDYGFSDEAWEALSEQAKEHELDEILKEFCNDLIDAAIYEVKE